jgi:diacylglycerol kinase (ATP)
MKKIGIAYNPISGRGIGHSLAMGLKQRLEQAGFEVPYHGEAKDLASSGNDLAGGLECLLVCGGDGTLMMLLPLLVARQIPVYMLPLGNESLFARAFSMSADFDDVVARLGCPKVVSCPVPQANGRFFFSMLSIGFDADVIARIARNRSKPIGHRGYLIPIVKEFIRHRPPKLNLRIDGKEELCGVSGFLIAANSPQYALGLRFVPEAKVDEESLVLRFFPFEARLGIVSCMLAAASGRARQRVCYAAREIMIESAADRQYQVQADGEWLGETPVCLAAGAGVLLVLDS